MENNKSLEGWEFIGNISAYDSFKHHCHNCELYGKEILGHARYRLINNNSDYLVTVNKDESEDVKRYSHRAGYFYFNFEE